MSERVVSVNTGMPREVPHAGSAVMTGIFKAPVDGPVMLGPEGLDGDGQADRSVHGGPFMAAYLYSADDYAWWAAELGRELPPATFGENLTITGFPDAEVRVGDRFRIGPVLVEATIPRTPCFKLGIRMGDKRFVPRFAEAGRLGFYVRVLETGPVAAGDAMTRAGRGTYDVTMAFLGRLHRDGGTAEEFRAALAPGDLLQPGWRTWLGKRLAEVSPGG
ncbi:MAG: MOSC domain-containing protein [Thermoleophilia bacterium]|nr:MOSC domain-containing protein [Thermoleophilia bacterium]